MVIYEARPGSTIQDAIRDSLKLAIINNDICQFGFNGRIIQVNKLSDPDVTYSNWANRKDQSRVVDADALTFFGPWQ